MQDTEYGMQDVRESLLIPYPESRIQNPESRIGSVLRKISYKIGVVMDPFSYLSKTNTEEIFPGSLGSSELP